MLKKFLLLFLLALSVSSIHAQTVAYVTNPGNNTVSVIDTSTNTVTGTIAVGNGPEGVVFSPDGTRAYVANSSGDTVSVIDTATNTVVATMTFAANSAPVALAITPDGQTLYVVEFAGEVQAVSTATNSVIATISLGGSPTTAAVTPDGAHVYVLDQAVTGGFFAVIDTATNSLSAGPFPVNSGFGRGGATVTEFPFSLSGNLAYLPGGLSFNTVSVISTATNTLAATVTLPAPFAGPNGVVITPDGSRLYISDFFGNVVDIIDTATNTVEPSSIPVGSLPIGLAITPDGAFVYVANSGDNTVSVISTATNTVLATVPVGQSPFDIAIANLHAPMATLTIENLVINSNLHEQGDFTLAANTSGIDLAHQPLTLTVNNFSLTIPAGSFKQVGGNMHFVFNGTVNGFKVNFNIQSEHGSSTQFDFVFDVQGVSITGPNPANISLGIGPNTGSTTSPF
jgi:YVTN family beta-propeller protein